MTIKVLIVGSGSIAKRHHRIIASHFPSVELGIISSRGFPVDTSEKINHRFVNFAEAYKFKPTISIICSPATYHLNHAYKLASVGSHLLIEKPLAISTVEVEALQKYVDKKKVHLAVGYNLRYSPSLIYFKKVLTENKLGRIHSVSAKVGQYLPLWRPEQNYQTSVSAQKELGGGVLLELSHEIDYLHWIFGRFIWVSSWVGKKSDLNINVDDTAFIQFETEMNIIGHIHLDFWRHDTTRTCEVVGEFGTLKWDGITQKVQFYCPKDSVWINLYDAQKNSDYSYLQQFKNFKNRDMLDMKEDNLKVFYDNEHTLKIIEKVHLAHAESCRKSIS